MYKQSITKAEFNIRDIFQIIFGFTEEMSNAVIQVKFDEKEIPNQWNQLIVNYSFNKLNFKTTLTLKNVIQELKDYLNADEIIKCNVSHNSITIRYWKPENEPTKKN